MSSDAKTSYKNNVKDTDNMIDCFYKHVLPFLCRNFPASTRIIGRLINHKSRNLITKLNNATVGVGNDGVLFLLMFDSYSGISTLELLLFDYKCVKWYIYSDVNSVSLASRPLITMREKRKLYETCFPSTYNPSNESIMIKTIRPMLKTIRPMLKIIRPMLKQESCMFEEFIDIIRKEEDLTLRALFMLSNKHKNSVQISNFVDFVGITSVADYILESNKGIDIIRLCCSGKLYPFFVSALKISFKRIVEGLGLVDHEWGYLTLISILKEEQINYDKDWLKTKYSSRLGTVMCCMSRYGNIANMKSRKERFILRSELYSATIEYVDGRKSKSRN